MRTRWTLQRRLVSDVVVSDAVSVDLPCSQQALWDFMWDPASTFVHAPGTEVATTLPGTPAREVGEVQVFVSRQDGVRTLTAIEVLEAEPPRLAVTRGLGFAVEQRQRLEITALGPSSCRAVQEYVTTLPAGLDEAQVAPLRAGIQAHLHVLRESLLAHFGAN